MLKGLLDTDMYKKSLAERKDISKDPADIRSDNDKILKKLDEVVYQLIMANRYLDIIAKIVVKK